MKVLRAKLKDEIVINSKGCKLLTDSSYDAFYVGYDQSKYDTRPRASNPQISNVTYLYIPVSEAKTVADMIYRALKEIKK
jgi:hypothetical protein